MEQEKLDEGQKFLQEDKERFDKMMSDSEKDAKDKADQVKKMALEKLRLIKKTEDLKAAIAVKENQIKKDDDELQVYKQQKLFLDVLAIQAGKKRYQNILDGQNLQGNDQSVQNLADINSNMNSTAGRRNVSNQGGATFMTSVKDSSSPQKALSKKTTMNKDLTETGGASKTNLEKGKASQSSNLRSGSNAGSRTGNLKAQSN